MSDLTYLQWVLFVDRGLAHHHACPRHAGKQESNSLPAALRREFKASLDVFLEVCREKQINPTKEFSGRFNLRIPPHLHQEVAARAASEDKSINQWVSEVLEHSVHE
jgi:predicted HicB family RNase H-like nuclease